MIYFYLSKNKNILKKLIKEQLYAWAFCPIWIKTIIEVSIIFIRTWCRHWHYYMNRQKCDNLFFPFFPNNIGNERNIQNMWKFDEQRIDSVGDIFGNMFSNKKLGNFYLYLRDLIMLLKLIFDIIYWYPVVYYSYSFLTWLLSVH